MIELDSTPIVVMIILGVAGMLLPVINVLRHERGSNSFYAVITFGALIAAIVYVISQIALGYVSATNILSSDVIANDMLGSFFALAMLIVAIFTTVSSFSYMKTKRYPAIYYSLILLSTVGMVMVSFANDLIILFVAWELMSIPTYVLVGFNKRDPSSNEAAIKYFMFGALASSIIIYAISLAYGLTGTTNIAGVFSGLASIDPSLLPIALLSGGLFIAGFGFKMGLVPFHMWLPDTYEGAPPPVTVLLAAGTKKAGFAAAIRIVIIGMAALSVDWSLALAIIAIMTMTIGNVAAIMQKSISRMLAYSSIGHAGYLLIGLAVAPYSATALPGTLLHVLNHAVMKGAAFVAIAGIVTVMAVTHIEKLRGLGRRMPITALGITISLLALAGVPPLSGFWSKLVLFGSAIDAGSAVSWGYWLAIAGVLNSALSLAYYGWIIRKMYFEDNNAPRVREPRSIVAIMIVSIAFIVGLGVYPEPMIQFAQSAAPSIGIFP